MVFADWFLNRFLNYLDGSTVVIDNAPEIKTELLQHILLSKNQPKLYKLNQLASEMKYEIV